MKPLDRTEAAAEAIAEARLARIPLSPLPATIRPRDETEAYTIQDAVHRRLASTRYGARVGWKIACTTKVMQDYLGIRNPCGAGLFAGTVHRGGVALTHSDYRQVGVECEIAVRLGRSLTAGEAPFDVETVAGAVAAYMAAIEIVDDRYADWRTTGTPTLIADDFFAAGAVLGPERVIAAEEIAAAIGTTAINAVEVGRGQGTDVMGHPLNALAWLANNLPARGQGLAEGEIVLTGSLVETRWLARGDRVRVEVAGLGDLDLTVI